MIFALAGITGGLLLTNNALQSNSRSNVYQNQVTFVNPSASSTPLDQTSALTPEPQNLIIPKINVNAVIEQVGEDLEGKMDVPKEAQNVGWYEFGYKPGEKGSAVLAGHLDTVTGAPAVFYNLGQLQIGDEVIVTDKSGKNMLFTVTKVQSYPFDQVPLQDIFTNNDKPRLNLITCTGTWNVGARNYSNRLVIYTELKSS